MDAIASTPIGSSVAPPHAAHRQEPDWARLAVWLRPHMPDLQGPLTSIAIDGGQSNPTWVLSSPTGQWVLRAKPGPAHTLLPSAHAIEREFQVMSVLANTGVPVPKVRVLCEDESLLGVAFYIMDYVPGRVQRDVSLQATPSNSRADYFWAMCDALVALHKVDWREVGLQDFGRHEGYFSRLIKRWGQQYQTCVSTPSEPMRQLQQWLPAHIPCGADGALDTCICHGDFRLENLMFHPTEPRVSAILDWELATLGHPLGDLAYSCLSWHLPGGLLRGLADTDCAALQLPSQRAYVQRYCQATGRDLRDLAPHWAFYLAFNLFRLSAILQGVAHRHAQGKASSDSAEVIGRMALPVAEIGWAIASGQRAAL